MDGERTDVAVEGVVGEVEGAGHGGHHAVHLHHVALEDHHARRQRALVHRGELLDLRVAEGRRPELGLEGLPVRSPGARIVG